MSLTAIAEQASNRVDVLQRIQRLSQTFQSDAVFFQDPIRHALRPSAALYVGVRSNLPPPFVSLGIPVTIGSQRLALTQKGRAR